MCVCIGKKTEAKKQKHPPPSFKQPAIEEGKVGGDDATGLTTVQDNPNKEDSNRQHERYVI